MGGVGIVPSSVVMKTFFVLIFLLCVASACAMPHSPCWAGVFNSACFDNEDKEREIRTKGRMDTYLAVSYMLNYGQESATAL